MTSFFPDLNVWLALSVAGHTHNANAWEWLNLTTPQSGLIFCRYTHLGLLRLLTNQAVMGEQTLSAAKAWAVYDRWREDPRVHYHPEPRGVEDVLREAILQLTAKPASKWIGDCYLLAFCRAASATLVTFDKGLARLAGKHRCKVIRPA